MIYVVGDIHGKFNPLVALMGNIKAHARTFDEEHKIVFVGDYIDRGGEENLVIDYLNENPAYGFEHIFLKGNHEEMAINSINGDWNALNMWKENGGNTTMRQYGLRAWDFPNKKSRIPVLEEFIAKTRLHYRVGKFYIVHAGINPTRRLEDQLEQDQLWIRQGFLNWTAPFDENVIVIHGHTPIANDPFMVKEWEPIQLINRINIDTGAVWTGILTAAIIDNKGTQFEGFINTAY